MPNKLKIPTNNGGKPYTIAMVGQNDAEINLYGEVVQSHPVDWWTGEKVPGNYIALDEILQELDELNTKDNITVHIHSVGGDFYAGLAIYNRLRNLKASITTVNDGLAASAGSLIFMAGDKGKRKVHAASNLMIHGVLTLLWGYYNAQDLKAEIKTIESHNKAAVAAYMEATGLEQDVIKAAMSKDTYMTGQEAVEAGWADEVITDDDGSLTMKLSPDKSCVFVNGYTVAARCLGKLPANIQQMTADEWTEMSTQKNGVEPHNHSAQPAPQVGDNTHSDDGGIEMEIKNMEDLRNAHPDLVSEIESAAQATATQNAVQAERTRLAEIDEIAGTISDPQMVHDAKFGENPMTAEKLLLAAAKAGKLVGNGTVNQMRKDAVNSGANAVTGAGAAADNLTDDEKAVNLLVGIAKAKKEGK